MWTWLSSRFGQPEIGDFGLPLGVRQEHVCRLEVTVDDPHQVRRVDCPGQCLDQRGRLFGRKRSAFDLAVQAATGTMLQCEEGQTIMFADFVDLDDVWMMECGERLGLGAETGKIGFASMFARQEHFQSDQSVEAQLPGFVHDAHAPATEFRQDLVSGTLTFSQGADKRSAAGSRGNTAVFGVEYNGSASGSTALIATSTLPFGSCSPDNAAQRCFAHQYWTWTGSKRCRVPRRQVIHGTWSTSPADFHPTPHASSQTDQC